MFLKFAVTSLIILCATCCPEDDFFSEDDCAAVTCAGPPALALRVLEDDENVFGNETFTLEDVVITGENSAEISSTIFETENGETLLFLDNFPWQLGENNYTLTIANETPITLLIDISFSEDIGCCGGIEQLDSFSSNGTTQELENGYFTIIIM